MFLEKFAFSGYFANNFERKGLASFYKTPPDHLEKVVMPTYTLIKMQVHFCQRIQIIYAYLHDSAKFDDYIRPIRSWTDNCEYPTAVIGDMNFHYPENHQMKTYMENNGFEQLIKKPTHDMGHILDHIYVNDYLSDMGVEIFQKPVHFTDHDVIFLKIKGYFD